VPSTKLRTRAESGGLEGGGLSIRVPVKAELAAYFSSTCPLDRYGLVGADIVYLRIEASSKFG